MKIKTKHLIVFSVIAIIIYYIPYFYLGENSNIRIHDNLDSNIAWAKVFIENTSFINNPNTIIQQILGGIPQANIEMSYQISMIWFYLFGMFWGYVINKIIMTFVAFVGMKFLLKKLKIDDFVSILVALLFSFLPFWSFTLSVAGLPLLLYVFLKIKDSEDKLTHWILLMLFPFYLGLVFSGLFFFCLLLPILIYDFYKRNKSLNFKFIFSVILLGIVFLVSEFPMFYSFLTASEITHRVEFQKDFIGFNKVLDKAWWLFYNGQTHAQSLHEYFIFILIAFGVIKFYKKEKASTFLFILLFISITSILYGLYRTETISNALKFIPIQLDRFYVLFPMLWFVLLAIALDRIYKFVGYRQIIIFIILLYPLIKILKKHEYRYNRHEPTFKQFYAEDLFDTIKQHIGLPLKDYRVVSVGLHPSIAQYNGFYTMDGYVPNYPLSYKHKFRKIISKELDKDLKLKKYFDTWGSRCYAFSSELGANYLDASPNEINNLEFDFEQMKIMGINYIISHTKINNHKNLVLSKKVNSEESYWTIHLYEVL